MKKSIYSLAVALFGSLFVTGCYEEPAELNSVNKSHLKGNGTVSITSAVADGESVINAEVSITSNEDFVYEAGVALATTENFAGAEVTYVAASADESGKLVATAKKLKGGTLYYVRAYAFGVDGDVVLSSNFVTAETEKPDTWSLVGVGDYVYNAWDGPEAIDPDLELYRSDKYPNKYKITHWFNDVDFVFEVNDNNEIDLAGQPTGFVDEDYGMVYVGSGYAYNSTKFPKGVYDPETKTYTFVNRYYCSAGTFNVDFDFFTLK